MSAVLIFDGLCNLCTHSVRFILEHETAPTICFTSVQSPAGSRLMRQLGLNPDDAKTFVLIENGIPFVRSEAAIHIARHLRLPWRFVTAARIVPRFLRDYCYDTVARNRYRWFGRRDACMVPSPDIMPRFLND